MMMGTLFKVLKVKTKSNDWLSIKAGQLIYFPRTLQENWLDKIFNGLGWNIISWVKSLISTGLLLLVVVVVVMLIYYCLKRELTNRTAFNRKIIQAVVKRQNPGESAVTPPPPCSEMNEL